MIKNINIKAITAGVLINIAGTIFLWILIMILINFVLYGEGIQGKTLIQNTLKVMHSTKCLVLLLIVGIFIDFFAGLLTGKIAGTLEITHACIVGVLLLLIGLAIPSSTPSTLPSWFCWSATLTTFPAIIAGGLVSNKFKNSSFLSTNMKEILWVLDVVIIFCFYKAVMLIGWSYITNKDIITSSIETLLWIFIAGGLIIKSNIARIAIIVWFGVEIILEVPCQLSHFSKINLAGVISLTFCILIRAFVIYYLRRESIKTRFIRDIPNVTSESG